MEREQLIRMFGNRLRIAKHLHHVGCFRELSQGSDRIRVPSLDKFGVHRHDPVSLLPQVLGDLCRRLHGLCRILHSQHRNAPRIPQDPLGNFPLLFLHSVLL
jgi:hypothetical protein